MKEWLADWLIPSIMATLFLGMVVLFGIDAVKDRGKDQERWKYLQTECKYLGNHHTGGFYSLNIAQFRCVDDTIIEMIIP